MRELIAPRVVKAILVAFALSMALATVSVVASGCGSPSKSKGFDEAD